MRVFSPASSLAILTLALTFPSISLAGSFSQLLDIYSFDYSAHKSPLAFVTFGSSVDLITKTKLIPQVQNTSGAYFLSKVSLPMSE